MRLRPLALCFSLPLLGACVEMQNDIRLESDGSGALSTTVRLTPPAAEFFSLILSVSDVLSDDAASAPSSPSTLCGHLQSSLADAPSPYLYDVPSGTDPAYSCRFTRFMTDWPTELASLLGDSPATSVERTSDGFYTVSNSSQAALAFLSTPEGSAEVCASAPEAERDACASLLAEQALTFAPAALVESWPLLVEELSMLESPPRMLTVVSGSALSSAEPIDGLDVVEGVDGRHRFIQTLVCDVAADPGCRALLTSAIWSFSVRAP